MPRSRADDLSPPFGLDLLTRFPQYTCRSERQRTFKAHGAIAFVPRSVSGNEVFKRGPKVDPVSLPVDFEEIGTEANVPDAE